MDYGAMVGKINSIHRKTGVSRPYILYDMWQCAKKYGAGYMDYNLYEMYDLTPEQRDTYITRGRTDDLVRKYNDPEYYYIFEDKRVFDDTFDKYLKRDWAGIDDMPASLELIEKHDILFAKPALGIGGGGVERIKTGEFKSAKDVYHHILSLGYDYIIEEPIVQNEAVSSIYPVSINTVRLVTILDSRGVGHVVNACFRIGNNGDHVDNFSHGGMVCPVDVATGIVTGPAEDKNQEVYETHPYTGTPITGFAFPNWNEAIKMTEEAAILIPQVAFVGWDIAFSVKGPVFVEGNHYPGHVLHQLPASTPSRIGDYSKYFVD